MVVTSVRNELQSLLNQTRYLFPFLFLLLISGCATTGVENIEKLDVNHRALVVSTLGNDFKIDSIGSTIFQSWKVVEDVSDWGIDNRMEAFIKSGLVKSGKIKVIPFDSAQVRSVVGPIPIDDWSGARKHTDGMRALCNIAKNANANSVLLVGTTPMMDAIHQRKSTIEGYGIYQSSFLGLKDAVDYVVLRIWLIDAETGKDIASNYKLGKSTRNNSTWLEKDQRLSDETMLEIKRHFESMLDSTLEKALKDLSLI